MISVTKLRNGVNYMEDGQLYRVVNYTHTHLSRGSGTIKVKCRNLRDGRMAQKTYKGNDKVEEIEVMKKILQFLYVDGEEYVFMDPESFDQVEISREVLGDDRKFLKEGEEVSVLYFGEEPLTVDLPPKMNFKVTEAAPGERGDSASNAYKDAVLENGLKIRVPLFINPGEVIRVDTRNGEYIERAIK